jgi:hypothetical protein
MILMAVCITFALPSCDSFLSLTPPSQATANNFYKTTADVTNAVTAAYSALRSGSMYTGHFIYLMEVRSDNIEDQNPGANAGMNYNIDRFLALADNGVVGDAYLALYGAISRCNNVLPHLDVVTDPALKNQYEGELRFLRALHYFQVVRLWGAAPLILSVVTTEESKNIGRSPVADVYAAIEADLTAAAGLLPAAYPKNADIGRATAGAAKALLAKVYLTEKKYSEAVNTLKALVPPQSNPYGYRLQARVADVFNASNKMNEEIIFAIRYDKTILGQGHGLFFGNPVLDPALLNAYESADARRDLLNTAQLNATTFLVKKYYDTYDPTNQNMGNDFVILRYADVLLMYAEALNEVSYNGDPNGDAFKYLNMVRTRSEATPFTPAQLASQASFRAAVLRERRLELPLELHRWFDLVRTATAIDALKTSALTPIAIEPYQYLYPVPQGQIETMNNQALYPQNPGYTK